MQFFILITVRSVSSNSFVISIVSKYLNVKPKPANTTFLFSSSNVLSIERQRGLMVLEKMTGFSKLKTAISWALITLGSELSKSSWTWIFDTLTTFLVSLKFYVSYLTVEKILPSKLLVSKPTARSVTSMVQWAAVSTWWLLIRAPSWEHFS